MPLDVDALQARLGDTSAAGVLAALSLGDQNAITHADWALLRDTGVAELLPSVDALGFDEAHQLAAAGVQFLGTVLSSTVVFYFGRDLVAGGLSHARGLA